MERDTKLITTPGGHTVVLKTYLSGRESKEIETVMYSALKMNPDNIEELPDGRKKIKMSDVSAEFIVEQEKKLIEVMLVSIDGTAENAFERLLDLPSPEYDAVKAEIEKLTNPTTPVNSEQLGQGTSEPGR